MAKGNGEDRWDGPEPLAVLLESIERFVRRYVVLTDEQGAAVALWIAHTHAIDAADCTPYLHISSPEKQSGKTRLLEVMELLAERSWFTGRLSPAVLYRKVDAESPTLLLDESDAAFKGAQEYVEALRGILNSGYLRGGKVSMCVGQGAKITYKDFSAFCPKAIAGIGELPDTIADRAIPIRLKRRKRSEDVQRFRRRDAAGLAGQLYSNLTYWSSAVIDVIEGLRAARPELPDELSDRAQDVWEPLLAIADRSAGQWPKRARAAAVALSSDGGSEEETLRVRLLADIRSAFDGQDRLGSAELLDHLRGLEEAPWADWYGKPLSGRKLADLLRPYEIRSRQIRLGEDETRKGYLREHFVDAWERYLPVPERNNRNNGSAEPKTPPSGAETETPSFRFESGQKPHEQAKVSTVSDSGPDTRSEVHQ